MNRELLAESWRNLISDYLNWLLARNYSRVQIQNRAYTLSRFARIMVDNGITPEKVNFKIAAKFLEYERGRKRPSSLSWEISILKSFYNYVRKLGKIDENPFEDMRVKGSGEGGLKALSEEELNRLLKAAYDLDPVKADAIKFLAYTGLRISEFLNLTSGNIDLENQVMRVFNVKTDKLDVVPLLKESLEILKRRKIEDLNKYHKSTYDRFLKKAAEKAGINKLVTVHVLRHTFVTMILARTKDPLLTKQLARHASLHTTSKYLYQEVSNTKKKLKELNLL